MTAGGGNANTRALRTLENFAMARFSSASTFSSADWRSSQSLSLTNESPTFWPVPEKLRPARVKQVATASFSSSMKWLRTCSMTRSVCSSVEPVGSVTCTNRMP